MSAFNNNSLATELPRQVYLAIFNVPHCITHEDLNRVLLSAYDDGTPSEFSAVSAMTAQTVSTETHLPIDSKTALIKVTFRDDMCECTRLAHLSAYVDGWALPVTMKYGNKTYRLFATLSDTHASTKQLKDLFKEREAAKARAYTDNLFMQMNRKTNELKAIERNLRKKEEELVRLREEFFLWTRKISQVA
jgi:hypothetical protein